MVGRLNLFKKSGKPRKRVCDKGHDTFIHGRNTQGFCRVCCRTFHLADNRKRQFGVTADQYNELFAKQHGCCAICGKHQDQLNCGLAIDHDHKTGQVRGLLCTVCNIHVIQVLENYPFLITKGQEYLKQQWNVI